MGASLPLSPAERAAHKLSGLYAEPLKAGLHPKEPERFLRDTAQDTIQATQKQSAAAEDIGLSEGRVSAKLADGSIQLRELERLGLSFAVRWAEEVLRQHGALVTPAARAKETIRIMRRCLDEIDQYLDHVG